MLPKVDEQLLVEAEKQLPYIIKRVKNQDSERLRYLEKEGLLPGARIVVKENGPFKGPLTLLVEEEEKVIGREIATIIFVAELSD